MTPDHGEVDEWDGNEETNQKNREKHSYEYCTVTTHARIDLSSASSPPPWRRTHPTPKHERNKKTRPWCITSQAAASSREVHGARELAESLRLEAVENR